MQDLANDYAGAGLREGASETLRGAKDKVSAAYDRTADQAQRAYYGARGFAVGNPGLAAAAVFAAGIGIGTLIGVRAAASAYRRRVVPGAALAFAQAVRGLFGRLR